MVARRSRTFLGCAFMSMFAIVGHFEAASSRPATREASSTSEPIFDEESDLKNIDMDLTRIEKGFDLDKPVSVPFPVLLKRAETYLLSEVCYQGVVIAVRDSLAGSTVLINVRTVDGLRPQNVALVESLESTALLPGNVVDFCGIVMGRTFVLTQPSSGHDAVQFDATRLRRVQPSHRRSKPSLPPEIPETSGCPASP